MWREESDSEWQKQEERGIERRETVMEREQRNKAGERGKGVCACVESK